MAEHHFDLPLDQLANQDPALGNAQGIDPVGNIVPQAQGRAQGRAMRPQQEQAQVLEPAGGQTIYQLPAAAAAIREQPRTYAHLYADVRQDPLTKSYPATMARFDAMVEEPEDSEELLNSALSNGMLPNTFWCCAVLNARPRIYVVHKLARYPRAFDGRETPWDHALFGFLGDVLGSAICEVIAG
jgi:hypothetical protein